MATALLEMPLELTTSSLLFSLLPRSYSSILLPLPFLPSPPPSLPMVKIETHPQETHSLLGEYSVLNSATETGFYGFVEDS